MRGKHHEEEYGVASEEHMWKYKNYATMIVSCYPSDDILIEFAATCCDSPFTLVGDRTYSCACGQTTTGWVNSSALYISDYHYEGVPLREELQADLKSLLEGYLQHFQPESSYENIITLNAAADELWEWVTKMGFVDDVAQLAQERD